MIENDTSFVGPDRSQNLQPSMFSDGGPDWHSIANTALSFAGPIGAIINPLLQWLTNEKNRRWQSEQAELQNERNIVQWQRENAYNLPSAMMQRYIDAGLNPNLIYGQPSLSADSPTMVAPFETPNAIAPQLDATALNQSSQLVHQNRLTDTEIKNLLSETPYSKANLDEKVQQVKLMTQTFEQQRYPTLLAQIKADFIERNEPFTIEYDTYDKDGNAIHSSFLSSAKDLLESIFSSELREDSLKVQFGIYDLMYQMGLYKDDGNSPMFWKYSQLYEHVHLTHEERMRLDAFNRFAKVLYEAQSESAVAQAAIDAYEASFWTGKTIMGMSVQMSSFMKNLAQFLKILTK